MFLLAVSGQLVKLVAVVEWYRSESEGMSMSVDAMIVDNGRHGTRELIQDGTYHGELVLF